MPLTPTLFTISALGVEFDMSHRKVGRLLKNVEPAKTRGKSKLYYIYQVAHILLGVDSDDLDLTTERARLAKAQADKTELQLEIDKSELLAVADVERNWSVVTQSIRAKLLALPTTLSVELIDMNQSEIEAVLDTHITNILADISETEVGT